MAETGQRHRSGRRLRLFVIEAMKMESTITSPLAGEVTLLPLKEKTLVEANDLVVRVG